MSDERVRNWEQKTEWPLAVIALLFLGAYAWPILDGNLNSALHGLCSAVDYAAWAAFVVDYVVRLSLADRRGHYFWHHLPDLAVIALPVLRPLRLLRLVMLLKVLNREATQSLRGRVAIYVTGAFVLLVFCASLAVLDAEKRGHGGNITNFGDALWWAVTTVTTVGYGDHYPLTGEGQFVAAGLMIGGIALLGIVTASFATWLIDRVRDAETESQAPTRTDLQVLSRQVEELTELVREMHAIHAAPQ
jgi:voltage-gated potassium channel